MLRFQDKEEIAVTDEHFVQTKETDGTARLVIKATKVELLIYCASTHKDEKERRDGFCCFDECVALALQSLLEFAFKGHGGGTKFAI